MLQIQIWKSSVVKKWKGIYRTDWEMDKWKKPVKLGHTLHIKIMIY